MKDDNKKTIEAQKEANRLQRLKRQLEKGPRRRNTDPVRKNTNEDEEVDDPLPIEQISSLQQQQKHKKKETKTSKSDQKIYKPEPKYRKKVGTKPSQSSHITTNSVPDSATGLSVGSWVIALYNNTQYPGRILKQVTGDEFEVKTMTPILYKGLKYWRWPVKEDRLIYAKEDLSPCEEPKKLQEKGRGAGLFLVNF